VSEALSDLEAVAVYRALYEEDVRVDPDRVAVSPPPSSTMAVPGMAKFGRQASLSDVDDRIRADEAFMRQRRNNSDNEEYVEDRLKELRAVRAYVAELLLEAVRARIDAGNLVLTEHANDPDIEVIERRARGAEGRLGSRGHANAGPMKTVSELLQELQDLQVRRAGLSGDEELHRAMVEPVTVERAAGSDEAWAVLAVHIRSSYYYSPFKPGRKTTLSFSDRYHVIAGTAETVRRSLTRWREKYDHGWCRDYEGGVRLRVWRSALTVINHSDGLTQASAKKAKTHMLQVLADRGCEPLRGGGRKGPGYGLKLPFTIPAGADDIPACER
jgi:hypothetical protein